VNAMRIGVTEGQSMRFGTGFEDKEVIALTALREASDSFFRDWMEG
jgi:hypothetical protein